MTENRSLPISGHSARQSNDDAQALVREVASNELVFAVVGPIGAGCSTTARELALLLASRGYSVETIRASSILEAAPNAANKLAGAKARSVHRIKLLQEIGDEIRQGEEAGVGRALVLEIRNRRAKSLNLPLGGADPIEPDGQKRAYILDSLKHPAEVELLRSLYQGAVVVIGVVCDYKIRLARIQAKLGDAGRDTAEPLMESDRKSQHSYGQQVADTFHLADVFIDNSEPAKQEEDGEPNGAWSVPRELERVVKIVCRVENVRPYPSETAMHAAYAAQTQSACLSRQVGAALTDRHGNLVATGTNEVPKAGGGVYGEDMDVSSDAPDFRCAAKNKYCSNTKTQNAIVDALVKQLTDGGVDKNKEDLRAILRKSPIAQLLEFSRAVHAEMDALLAAARTGHSTVGCKMFVTTYPCHYCARHIVAAGVDEIQFVEPYAKSKALELHSDALTQNSVGWIAPSRSNTGRARVLVRPFVGVAPRLYQRAFYKDRNLKDAQGDMIEGAPAWGSPWRVPRVSYAKLEALLLPEMPEQPIAPQRRDSGKGSDILKFKLPEVRTSPEGDVEEPK